MRYQNCNSIWSRRAFIKATVPTALAHLASGYGLARVAESRPVFAYVGSYTSLVDEGANGQGIYRFEVDLRTGIFTGQKLVAATPNPSWIVIHPSRKYLYAVNEIVTQASGSVSAYAIEPATGDLTPLNTVDSEGRGPAHMSIDATGKFAFVANYGGGTFAVLPILDDGKLGRSVDVRHDSGSIGARTAANAPRGSFSISGHDAPHVHMIAADPTNRFVLAVDLGQDRIYVNRFDSSTGKLTPSEVMRFFTFPSGDGPRHFAFHPNGRWVYVLSEESSTVTYFHYEAARGALSMQQSVSSLPDGFAGSNFTSEVVVSSDGRFLYAANRLHDTIAIFVIDGSGRLKRSGEVSSMGDFPRHCTFDPSGRYFYICNQHSDSITRFEVDRETGLLSFTGDYIAVGSPAIVTFLS